MKADSPKLQVKPPRSISQPKRFSVALRNIDFNAYRAFKIAEDEVEDPNLLYKRKNPYEMLHHGGHNLMRFPFGLKEKRFRWQTNKNLGEKCELKGNTKKYHNKNNSVGDWEALMNKTSEEIKPKKLSSNKAASYKFQENKNSSRIFAPELDHSTDEQINPRNGRRSVADETKRSTATGSLSNLLGKTPMNECKPKKYAERLTQGNEIFTPKIEEKTKGIKVKGTEDSLVLGGRKTQKEIEEESKKSANLSLSASVKSMHLSSDIFQRSQQSEKHPINKNLVSGLKPAKRTGNFGLDDNSKSGKNIFKSSIVF
jgi:hypothetical protein